MRIIIILIREQNYSNYSNSFPTSDLLVLHHVDFVDIDRRGLHSLASLL